MTVDLFEVLEATWPPVARVTKGVVTYRDGGGGGNRVSATTVSPGFEATDLDRLDQGPGGGAAPVMIRGARDAALDLALTARGYGIRDATLFYAAPCKDLARPIPPLAGILSDGPLAALNEVWTEGGIGAERQAIMARAVGPKSWILGRHRDKAAGAAFVALYQDTAMLHAIEVRPTERRNGVASALVARAATWAQSKDATTLILAVTEANTGARSAYASLGMTVVGNYHYRTQPGPPLI
ncbi:MAG: GNAT family N-acetyltransferase [Pseudomonadota bacterium]